MGGKKRVIDWEAVEREYRIGVRSLRDIATEYGCSEGAIRKKAKAEPWDRDLSAKIASRANALVRKEEVRKEVRSESVISEKEQINASATMMADTILGQRTDIQRAIRIINQLWGEIEAEGEYTEEFRAMGEMLRSENEFGEDKLNDLYRAAIGMPQRVKSVKLLADALKVLIDLQRRVLKLDEYSPESTAPVTRIELIGLTAA